MFKSKYINSMLLTVTLCNVDVAQAVPWLQAKTSSQLMHDPALQQEMQNIKQQTQCDSFLYQADNGLVVASSADYVGVNCPIAKQFIELGLEHEEVPVNSAVKFGSMLRFEVDGNAYILGLRGDLEHCNKQIKSSIAGLKPLL